MHLLIFIFLKTCKTWKRKDNLIHCQEIKIFEIEKNSKIIKYSNYQQDFLWYFLKRKEMYEHAEEIITDNGSHHDKDVFRLTPGIENHAAKKQYGITEFCGTQKIYRKKYREEPEKKNQA